MAAKTIGELNGSWAAWFKLVLGVIVPVTTAALIPFGIHVVNTLHRLDSELVRANEQRVEMSRRVSNVEISNFNQWQTIATNSRELQDTTTRVRAVEKRADSYDAMMARILDKIDKIKQP